MPAEYCRVFVTGDPEPFEVAMPYAKAVAHLGFHLKDSKPLIRMALSSGTSAHFRCEHVVAILDGPIEP